MNGIDKDKTYECKHCLNIRTPLCELCNQVTSPSGKKNKPTYYVSASERSNKPESQEFLLLSINLTLALLMDKPVKLSWIFRYNQLLSDDDE